MFFPLRSNLPTSPFTAAHHASRLALTLMASLLLAACGSSTPAPATPTPTPLLAPNLGTVSAQTYTQDTAITPLVFGNTGGDATSCTIDNPGLPTGLNVRVFPDNGKRTCRITGAPMEVVSPARMVTITATNTAGSDTATVSIIVNPAATLIAPTNLAPLVSGSQSPGEGIVIASNGVALMQNSCVFSSSGQTSQTLDGLKLITDASGCRITGTPTPTASATSRSYTILAVSVNGDDLEIMITLMVLPAPAAPDLPDGAVTALVVDGASVGTVTIANTGDNPNTCQFVDPAGDTDATLVSTLDGISVTVATNNTDCEITGALTGTGTKEFTVRATNATDSDNATVQFTVNPAAPDLRARGLGAQSYSTGAPVNVKLDNDGGGELTECGFDRNNPLPNGLMVTTNTTNDSCLITGTPNTAKAAANYEITATNITGSDSVTVSIAVISGIASFAPPGVLVYTVGDSVSESFDNTSTMGGRVTDCIEPAGVTLPAGLNIDILAAPGNGCTLTGTANAITTQANYTITATNNNGDASLTLDITVNPAAPKLSSVNAQVYTPNTDITDLVFTNTGGDVTNDATGCTVAPALPAELSVAVATSAADKRTCRITGNPTTPVATTDYKITATNITGSDTVTVPITVSSGIVPDSLSGQNLFRYEAGQTVPVTRQITFTNFGGDLTSCTASDLPAGMRINSTSTPDCTISGTPSRIMAQTTTHTITAMHMDGATSTATISIETYLSAPPSLSDYSGVTLADGTFAGVTLVVGSTVGLPIVLENTGGLVGENGCQVTSDNAEGSQPLSSFGLEVAVTSDSSSCEIKAVDTGSTITLSRGRYSISATNDVGISGAIVTITIAGDDDGVLAPTLTAPASSFTFATNEAIDPIIFTLGDDEVIGICTISEALPAGLRLNPSTCQITGTPVEAVSPARTVTITATNAAGSGSADISITVTNAAPALERMIDLGLTMNSNAGLPFAIANTGGSPTDCAADPTTAGDDDLDSYNLIIFVADGTCVIDSPDGNGPSRTLDGGSFTITASGTPASAATLTLNLRSPATLHIATGFNRTFAINSVGQLFGWGDNFENRLGLGDPGNFLDSVFEPTLLAGNNWVQINAGNDHTCAINTSGQLWCWGTGGSGRLGLGNNNSTNKPMQAGSAIDWVQINAGSDHTCAINTSGQLWCWGIGGSGRLGLGNNNNTNTPTQVVKAQEGSNNSDWMQVSAGGAHTCAINTSGQLWCWGTSGEGQLGLGDDASENTPTQVGGANGASDWTQVSTGREHTCAIKVSGQLWCWGTSGSGQLGLGNNNSTNTPTQVVKAQEGSNNSDWMQVNAGTAHTCAINTSRQLWCWGSDGDGQLGLGGSTDKNTPMRVGGASGASDWMQVDAGHDYTCAIKASEQLWCWGLGREGQLGLGGNTSMNTPALVRGNSALTPVTAPNLSDASAQTYTQHTAITNLVFTNTGGDVRASTGCAVATSGGLPAGLSVGVVTDDNGKRTCQITGAPTEVVSPARMVTITATNTTGSDSVTVSITVNLPATPNLSTVNPQPYTQHTLITPLVFTNTGGDVTASTGCAVAISGGLPAGLSVGVVTDDNGKRTCQITGAPTEVVSPARMVTITATNTGGSASVTVSIIVNLPAAPDLDIVSAQTYTQHTAITNLVFTNTGGDVDVDTNNGCIVDTSDNKPDLPAGLDVEVVTVDGKETCQIFGAPTEVVSPARMVTITATNAGGSATATVSIIVNSRIVPVSSSPQALFRYEAGQTVPDTRQITFTNAGDTIQSCTATNLPDGMMIDRMNCTISGEPSRIKNETTEHTITATYMGSMGSTTSEAMISIETYLSGPPVISDYSGVTLADEALAGVTLVVGSAVGLPIVLENTGGPVGENGCEVTSDNANGKRPLGNFGLELAVTADSSSCEIRAMNNTDPAAPIPPTLPVEKTEYDITATNDLDSSEATAILTILADSNDLTAPTLTAPTGSPFIFTTNMNTAITPIDFAPGGGALGICTISPALPAGLSFDPSTCQITGTPTGMVSTARMVTITAANAIGSASATVSIVVNSRIAPVSSSTQGLFRYEAGRTVPSTRQISFTNTDVVAIRSCAATDLPDGMTINSNDCTISGAPSRTTAETTTHTITATYTDNTTGGATIFIETYFSAPPSLSDYSGVTLVVGSAVGLPIVLENTGGMVGENGCQVILDSSAGQQALNNFGLALVVTDDNSSCEIKRVTNTAPTATAEETGYNITATNNLGVSGATATLTIIGASDALPAPTLTAPTPSSFTFALHTAITAIDFTLIGKLGICTISPALPAGLRFDPSTCQISGTPRVALTETSYTITATNNTTPPATATVAITVTDAAPALESMVALGLTLNSNAGLPFAIANTGGSPTTCTAAPTTDGDDALDSYNLTTFDASGTCVIDSLDGNGPSRTLDGGSFTITPSSGATSTLTLNLRTPATPQISAGRNGTYAINSVRQLFGWGNNSENRLGLGDLEDFLNPISTPALLTANDWEQVTSGESHTCAINASGELFCWGSGSLGQLGLGSNTTANTPTRVGGASDWMQVSAGEVHACAINTSGQLFCWGSGSSFRLGLGSSTNINTPTQVGTATNWMQVSAGGGHTCAINASGQLWCWGSGNNGQLGIGANSGTLTPRRAGTATNWMQVTSGESHTCAIKAAGQLWCWGAGGNGQLGLGNDNSTNTPTQVGDASDWMQVDSGGAHTCAIKAAGQLWCWGFGLSGQLGLGANRSTNAPMKAGSDSDWVQLSAGANHTCAIKTSGQVWCWGEGGNGQLGLGSNAGTNTPTLVSGIPLQ